MPPADLNAFVSDPRFFFVWFAFVWISVNFLISRMGWSKLAAQYRASHRPAGKTMTLQSMTIGFWSNYRGCLTFVLSPEGLYLVPIFLFRLFHPPVLIPWRDFRNRTEKTYFWIRRIEVEVGRESTVKLLLPPHVLESPEAQIIR